MILHVPEDWQVVAAIANSLGSVEVPVSPHGNPEKKLILKGDNNLGSISVKYVAVRTDTEE